MKLTAAEVKALNSCWLGLVKRVYRPTGNAVRGANGAVVAKLQSYGLVRETPLVTGRSAQHYRILPTELGALLITEFREATR